MENELEKPNKEKKSPIQKIEKIIIPKDQAKIEWKKYIDLLKIRTDKHLKIMKEAMYNAKEGKELIDIYEVFRKGGLNSNLEPRFAIARADLHEVFFQRRDEGTGIFGQREKYGEQIKWEKTKIELPSKTFDVHWSRILENGNQTSWIDKPLIKTKVPIIPAELMPEGDLENYYILWEVKKWEKLLEKKDPFLLKRISENLFVILSQWEVTDLERAIINGLKE